MSIIKRWRLIHRYAEASLVVEAIGPKDALRLIDGFEPLVEQEGWLISKNWKVQLGSSEASQGVQSQQLAKRGW